jgi:hypothetical protein
VKKNNFATFGPPSRQGTDGRTMSSDVTVSRARHSLSSQAFGAAVQLVADTVDASEII